MASTWPKYPHQLEPFASKFERAEGYMHFYEDLIWADPDIEKTVYKAFFAPHPKAVDVPLVHTRARETMILGMMAVVSWVSVGCMVGCEKRVISQHFNKFREELKSDSDTKESVDLLIRYLNQTPLDSDQHTLEMSQNKECDEIDGLVDHSDDEEVENQELNKQRIIRKNKRIAFLYNARRAVVNIVDHWVRVDAAKREHKSKIVGRSIDRMAQNIQTMDEISKNMMKNLHDLNEMQKKLEQVASHSNRCIMAHSTKRKADNVLDGVEPVRRSRSV